MGIDCPISQSSPSILLPPHSTPNLHPTLLAPTHQDTAGCPLPPPRCPGRAVPGWLSEDAVLWGRESRRSVSLASHCLGDSLGLALGKSGRREQRELGWGEPGRTHGGENLAPRGHPAHSTAQFTPARSPPQAWPSRTLLAHEHRQLPALPAPVDGAILVQQLHLVVLGRREGVG